MLNKSNINKNNNLSDKSNNNDVYEQMEIDNLGKQLIQKGKNKKKFSSMKIDKIILRIIILSIIFFLILIFFFFINNENNNHEMAFKNMTLNYIIDYKKNKIRNYRAHEDFEALSMSQFPSGNIIVHDKVLIIIYDNNFKELQQIYPFDVDRLQAKKHFPKIRKLIIKDENNFIISTSYGSIKFYTKNNNEFGLKNEIKDIAVSNVYLNSNKDKLFSLCNKSLIIFEENNKGDFDIKKNISLSNIENVNINIIRIGNLYNDIMVLEDKNILIVKQVNSIKFYNMENNYELIYIFKDEGIITIERFEDDKLLVICDYNYFKIISIYENKVFSSIKTNFELVDVKYYKDKGIIILGGAFEVSDRHMRICHSQIRIYRYDNLELIKDIRDEKFYTVNEINILPDGNVAICYGSALTFYNIDENEN